MFPETQMSCFCVGCHMKEPAGLFGMLAAINKQREGPTSTPDIFVCNFIPFARPAAVEASKHRRLSISLQTNDGIPDTTRQ